jgi:hypothetical protein
MSNNYAGLDEYVPGEILKRRTVRHECQALVRWKPGWTAFSPADPFWAEVESVIKRHRDGTSVVRWKDSWEIAEDVDAAMAAAATGRSYYATTTATATTTRAISGKSQKTREAGKLPPRGPTKAKPLNLRVPDAPRCARQLQGPRKAPRVGLASAPSVNSGGVDARSDAKADTGRNKEQMGKYASIATRSPSIASAPPPVASIRPTPTTSTVSSKTGSFSTPCSKANSLNQAASIANSKKPHSSPQRGQTPVPAPAPAPAPAPVLVPVHAPVQVHAPVPAPVHAPALAPAPTSVPGPTSSSGYESGNSHSNDSDMELADSSPSPTMRKRKAVQPLRARSRSPSESSGSLKPPRAPHGGGSKVNNASPKRQHKKPRRPPAHAPGPSEALAYDFHYEVPEEDDSSMSPDVDDNKVPPPSRRRVAKPETWKRNTRPSTLIVSEKPPCSCTLKCFQRIGRARRKEIRAAFAKLDNGQQKEHMAGLIDLHPVVFKGLALQIARKRQQKKFTSLYHIQVNHKRERVCSKAFLAFLGIGGRRVKNLNKYRWEHPTDASALPPDNRGKHLNRPNRIPDEIVKQVDEHIASFPRESSHYALQTEKKFLSSDLSCRKMYHLYLRKYEPGTLPGHGSESDSDSESEEENVGDGEAQSKPLVTYAFYTGRFNTFDLSFAKPLVDSCATCDELNTQLSVAADEETADALRAKRKSHLQEADRGYAMRKHDQELAEASQKSEANGALPSEDHNTWDGVEFVCSDMAGVLVTPKVSVNKAFYLRKMNTYCYGIFSGMANQHSLCWWNETVAQKGSNEVISSAHEFFVKRKTGATRLNWVHFRSLDLCCVTCIVPAAHVQSLSYTRSGVTIQAPR